MGSVGAYVYGVVSCDEVISLGNIGIGGSAVATIPAGTIAAVIHWCDPDDYRSEDPEMIRSWVVAHQDAVDSAWKRFGEILPMHFGTVVTGCDGNGVIGKVTGWLGEDREKFVTLLNRLRGRAEYGVQAFWNSADLKEGIITGDQDLVEKRAALNGMSKGMAYLKRQGLEALVRERLERRIKERRSTIIEDIRPLVEDLVVEQCDGADSDKIMILKASCLADDGQASRLGEALEELERRCGLSVRFTGPWPPYSFVSV